MLWYNCSGGSVDAAESENKLFDNGEKMKVGIYAPYLNTCGGGEKYICTIAEILSKKCDVEFIVFEEPAISELERKLNVNLSKVKIRKLCIPTLVDTPKVRNLFRIKTISAATKNYDLFINQEICSIIPAKSPKNIYLCQVPLRSLSGKFYKRFIKKLLFDPELKTYNIIMVYSYFVKKWVEKYYGGKNIVVLYPPVDTGQFLPGNKKNIILSVGRFFVGWHSKKQFEMIKTFKEMYDTNKNLKGWEYHLVGGVSNNERDLIYLEKCQKEAQGYPIYFHVNTPFEELKTLYGSAKIFWHATGFGEDETEHPERMEHFGITTVEAMAARCVPIVINKGGQPEIVRSYVDGFLWNTLEELKGYTLKLIENEELMRKMSQSALKRAHVFDIQNFKRNAEFILFRY